MDINGVGGQNFSQPAASFAPQTENRQAEVNAQRVPEAAKGEDILNKNSGDDASRFELVKQAAQKYVANLYAVSDTRFTTYRRGVGDGSFFETRFTSLETGEVTIVPDKQMFEELGIDTGSLVRASV